MAMCLLKHNILVHLLIKYLLILCESGLLTTNKITVNANGNTIISGPFLQLEKPELTKLLITKHHLYHYLPCIATIEENYYDISNETYYFYTWYRNDQIVEIHSGRNEFKLYRNGTLRLPPTERAAGAYRCKINANTTAVLSELIKVEYPVLKRVTAPANITAAAGLPLSLDCPVVSVPPANVSWFYGNVSLSKQFKDNRYLILANGTLVLRKLTLDAAGRYKCLAQNQFAFKTHRQFMFTLNVLEDLMTTDPNELLPSLQNSTLYVATGANCQLRCYHQMDGGPLIEWWYRSGLNGMPLKISNHSNEYIIEQASQEANQGYYSCSSGRSNQTFHVIVTSPPVIVEPLVSYETLITASLQFRCSATGNPQPVISWYHNGVPLNSSYTRYIIGNELHIHSFDPIEAGIYQCFARNIAGEVYSAGELRFRNKNDELLLKNPLQNIRCYALSFNTINVTFESNFFESLFIVHIVQNNPHRWISPFAPMKLNHTSHLVISSHLPVYRPFELITRVLVPTSEIRLANKPQQQTILSSLRSPPVTCCTQGLLLHLVHMGNNDTFVTWSQPELEGKKYFILQFSNNYTQPHPQQLLTQRLRGTLQHVDLTQQDVARRLCDITALDEMETLAVLRNAQAQYLDNNSHVEMEEEVFNLVVYANVTGVLLQHFQRIKLRVLIVTRENEHLKQDFRYVQWKTIENDTNELANTPFRLSVVESRMLTFHFRENFNESCVHVCHWQIQFPIIRKEEPKCEQLPIANSQVIIRGLKPSERYRVNFFSCESQTFYGQVDKQTLPDPPGTISNQRIIRHNGLKLVWDPPLQPNGKIHHYNILWTLGNVTHEINILDCTICSFKFPNISETAKINVTVRVVGETGVGAPIFIDLRSISHHSLEIECPSGESEVYSGIIIGTLLSVVCVVVFALLIIFQRRRYKARTQGPTHLSSPSDMNFSNLNNPSIPSESAGGLSGSTFQQDCHEMQTLIPKSGRYVDLHAARTKEYQTTQLPNGNGNIAQRELLTVEVQPHTHCVQTESVLDGGGANMSQLPLCSSTPEKGPPPDGPHPFFIPFKQTPPNTVATALPKQSSSSNPHATNGVGAICSADDASGFIMPSHTSSTPPTTLTLGLTGQQRSGSVGSSSCGGSSSGPNGSRSNSSSNSSCNKKQFHANYSKHSKSNDVICLLADEEVAATLTPTSEAAVALVLTNGFKAAAAVKTATAIAPGGEPAARRTATDVVPVVQKPAAATSTSAARHISTQPNKFASLAGSSTKSQRSSTAKRKRSAASSKPNKSAALSCGNNSIVPAIGSSSVGAAAPTPNPWSTTIPQFIATTASSSSSTPAASSASNAFSVAFSGVHRRPNVDPNG
uniref:Cell adhesion molecule-related/down-regulated by oncogenes n=2 Tax=Ceratitis capitata TaxID=7213 RepID=W8BCB8_CERCA